MIKTLLRILLAQFFIFSMVSCKDDDPEPQESPEEIAVRELTDGGNANWVVANGGSVTQDGTNITSSFSAFEIRFVSNQERKYTSTSNTLFDPSGTWEFSGNNFDKIQLDGTLPAAGNEISFSRTGDQLILMFTVPFPEQARVTALAGSYVFELVKE